MNDNAMAEAFFATPECELLDRRSFRSRAEGRVAVFHFVEGFYTRPGASRPWATSRPLEYEAGAMAGNN
jgi:putative transposase